MFFTRRSVISVVMFVLAASVPASAQQMHGNYQSHAHDQIQRPPQFSQMSNMLDQVETGHSPTSPASRHSVGGAHSAPMRSLLGARTPSAVGHGMYPAMGHAPAMMGHGMSPATAMMGHGMGSMHGMGSIQGLGSIHGMGGMRPMGGTALGSLKQSMGSGGSGASFLQKLKQKFAAMEQPGGSAGGVPGMPGGSGAGAQSQLMQKLFQQQPGAGAMGRPSATPFGGMHIPPSRGGMGMAPMMGSHPMPSMSPSSGIIRPGATAVGAPTGKMSDLERQMEQQYGH